uniref:Secreted protein n=1 Tax=Oncorhynchus tshawytscha TaxID=74940 RepID=A0AAZ3Q607_ONCTS
MATSSLTVCRRLCLCFISSHWLNRWSLKPISSSTAIMEASWLAGSTPRCSEGGGGARSNDPKCHKACQKKAVSQLYHQ